ncbi:hypothetical protein E4U23_001032 [Claviceps purpurea]|nr:hypothetical protein E4U23_001032 [Claviceps purpurea]
MPQRQMLPSALNPPNVPYALNARRKESALCSQLHKSPPSPAESKPAKPTQTDGALENKAFFTHHDPFSLVPIFGPQFSHLPFPADDEPSHPQPPAVKQASKSPGDTKTGADFRYSV